MKSKIIVALLIMNMVISASAQNQNQYGLVYRDAVSENNGWKSKYTSCLV